MIKEAINAISEGMKKSKLSDYELLRIAYAQYGGEWGEINIFGVRNSRANRRKDAFVDVIGMAYDENIILFTGTVDPGTYWVDNPVTVDGVTGAAHVCFGFHKNIWQVGNHPGQKNVLIQTGAKIKVWRDKNANWIQDGDDPVQSGYYGINMHSAKDSPTIYNWSAGCQVIQKQADTDAAMKIIMGSNGYKKDKAAKFSYMLFTDIQVPFIKVG